MTDLWREDVWMGMTIWRCGLCPWDTVDGLEVMLDHLVGRHGEGTEDGRRGTEGDEGLDVVQDLDDEYIDSEDFIFEEVGDAKDEFDAEDGAG